MTEPTTSPRPRQHRIAVFNDSAPTLGTLAKWFEIHGYGVVTAQLSMMRQVFTSIERVVLSYRPAAVVFDLAMPYEANWDFCEVVRLMPAFAGVPIVLTTGNKVALEHLVGPTSALQIVGKRDDLNALLRAVGDAIVAGRRQR